MNLRDKFIWNVLISLAFIAVAWYGWELFNNNSRMKELELNYKDKLDSAILRPGRVDYKLEFTYATKYQISEMYKGNQKGIGPPP